MRARKVEATTPDNLENQNFIANRLWALALRDEAAEVYERAFTAALAVVPNFHGRDNETARPELVEGSVVRQALKKQLYLLTKTMGYKTSK